MVGEVRKQKVEKCCEVNEIFIQLNQSETINTISKQALLG